MLTLAFDTSMGACSAAVFDTAAGRLLAEAYEPMERGHAERLAPMIREVMKEAGAEFHSLGRIAVTTGPGTFTGLRIGLAMARGFGVSLGIPLAGLTSLAAIAANESDDATRAVAVEARNGEIYFAVYGPHGAVVVEPQLIRPEDAKVQLPGSQLLLLGTAAERLMGADAHARSQAGDLPRAGHFAAMAARLDAGSQPPSPLYLRQPDIKPQYSVQRIGESQKLAATLLADLHGESFEPGWSRDEFSTMLAVPNTSALIIIHAGEPTGFGLFRQAADEAEIITLAMRPGFRRRGLGRALMSEIEKDLKGRGAQALFLEVAASNAAARALYARAGFREAGRRKGYYARSSGREDALVLRKSL